MRHQFHPSLLFPGILVMLFGLLTCSTPASAGGHGNLENPGNTDSEAAACSERPTLQDCLRAALQTNPAILSAGDGTKASRQRKERAESARLPRIKAEDTITRLRHVSSIDVPLAGSMPMGKDQIEIKAVRMSQPIYTGGAIENGIRAAHAEVNLYKNLETRQREDIARSVAKAWFGLLSARAMEQVASQALHDTLGHERNVADLLEAGVAIRDDLLKVQVSVLERRENLVRARNGINLACSRLNMLSGLSIAAETPLASDSGGILPTVEEATARSLASAGHPLISAAREKVRIGELSSKAARGSLLPTVALQWNWTSGTQFTPAQDNWDATIYVGLNLFDAGEARSKIREARAERDKAAHDCADLQRNIDLAIRQAKLQIEEAEARLELAGQAELQAIESMRLTEERYRAGAATSQSLLDAESALVAARQRGITAGFDRELAKTALWHAAGKLTETLLPKNLDTNGRE